MIDYPEDPDDNATPIPSTLRPGAVGDKFTVYVDDDALDRYVLSTGPPEAASPGILGDVTAEHGGDPNDEHGMVGSGEEVNNNATIPDDETVSEYDNSGTYELPVLPRENERSYFDMDGDEEMVDANATFPNDEPVANYGHARPSHRRAQFFDDDEVMKDADAPRSSPWADYHDELYEFLGPLSDEIKPMQDGDNDENMIDAANFPNHRSSSQNAHPVRSFNKENLPPSSASPPIEIPSDLPDYVDDSSSNYGPGDYGVEDVSRNHDFPIRLDDDVEMEDAPNDTAILSALDHVSEGMTSILQDVSHLYENSIVSQTNEAVGGDVDLEGNNADDGPGEVSFRGLRTITNLLDDSDNESADISYYETLANQENQDLEEGEIE